MSLEGKAKKNYIYNLCYNILVLIIPFITAPYISRVLGKELIGIYSYTHAIVSYFSIFGLLGAHTYGQLEVSKKRNDKEELSKVFNDVLGCKFLTMTVSIVVFLFFIFFTKQYREVYIIMLLILISAELDVSWLFQGLEEFKFIVVRNIVIRIMSVVFIFGLVKDKDDFVIYLIIMIAGDLLGAISLWTKVRRYVYFIKPNLSRIFKTLRNNLKYFVPSIATIAFVSLDKCMIGWLTVGPTENGYYEQANRIYGMLVTVVTSLTVVLLPRITYLISNNEDKKKLYEFINSNIIFIEMITVPLCIGVYLVSPEFVPLYYGAGYDSCIPMIQVFSLILVVTSLNSIISNQCLVATGKQKKLNGFLIASSLINAVANFVFIQLAGGLGATIASFVSELFLLVLLIVYDKDIVDVKNFLRKMLGYILKSFPMIGGVYCIQKISINSGILSIMLQVIVGVFLYFIMMFITKDDCFMKIFNGVIKRKRR